MTPLDRLAILSAYVDSPSPRQIGREIYRTKSNGKGAMATNIKQIIYFHPRLDAAAAAIRDKRSDIDMFRRDFGGPAADNWADMSRAHGYHACARTEMREPWFPDARLFAKAPSLLAVCSLGAGYDVIDVDACTKAGILVCNQSGANKEAVAEHAVGLMLAMSKKIMETDRAIRKENNIERFRYIGTELLGKTIGIIGLGNIGSRVAEICRSAFRMTVLAYDAYLSKEKMAARNAEKAELKDILQRADYVTMHCPRTEETFGMIGYDEFSLMKPTAFFINTSRGGTYNESDLARALGERKIAGAGIDVFLEEPPPTDHPLMAFDNVILTPHNAGSTSEAHENVAIYASDQWIDIFDGKMPPRLINKAAWPKYSERFQKILGFKPEPLREE
jgi:D-3-phosphoglycerate dehydrogenase / 2-oxoglutarate reductase